MTDHENDDLQPADVASSGDFGGFDEFAMSGLAEEALRENRSKLVDLVKAGCRAWMATRMDTSRYKAEIEQAIQKYISCADPFLVTILVVRYLCSKKGAPGDE